MGLYLFSRSSADSPRAAADRPIIINQPYPRDRTSYGPDQVVCSTGGKARTPEVSPRIQFVPGNPNPSRYKILKEETVGSFLIVDIQYEDCKNYEGRKILVFKDVTFIDLVNQKLIDPHFCDNDKFISPVARFEPTERGWEWAKLFAKNIP